MIMHKYLYRLLVVLLISLTQAVSAFAETDFLPPEKAFQFSARMADAKTIVVSFQIADGYYLYRERLGFKAEGATLGKPEIPRGKIKFDPNFDKDVETLRQHIEIPIPVQATGSFTLTVASQGCSDKGLCYAPMESITRFPIQTLRGDDAAQPIEAQPTEAAQSIGAASDTEMGRIEASLASGRLSVILPLFLLLGIGLSFTPCVLPMVPILSFIIVGEGTQTSRRRAFLLSVAYSLGMALVYTALGIAAGLVGEGLSAALQSPALLTAFALFLVVLSLSMFDIYQLQVPASVQLMLTQLSERQQGGKLIGVFVMGAISALIVGPCVAAPLAGALVYISQTRDVLIGGSALFAMAAGMSVPLLLVGLSAGTLLPRAGHWMQAVKPLFGVLMLALALWMVNSLIPGWVLMLGWGTLGVGYGIFLLRSTRLGAVARFVGLIFVLIGLLQWVGLAAGSRDPWAPLAGLSGEKVNKVEFRRIKTAEELDRAIADAAGKRVMLDFYADWCVSCIEMEKLTFTDPRVRAVMDEMLLLQADVTANDADDKALLKRFGLFGPPGILFFDSQGRELRSARVIGYQNPVRFMESLRNVVAGASAATTTSPPAK
jgi:thiol:disulfide interchange protein DsbD